MTATTLTRHDRWLMQICRSDPNTYAMGLNQCKHITFVEYICQSTKREHTDLQAIMDEIFYCWRINQWTIRRKNQSQFRGVVPTKRIWCYTVRRAECFGQQLRQSKEFCTSPHLVGDRHDRRRWPPQLCSQDYLLMRAHSRFAERKKNEKLINHKQFDSHKFTVCIGRTSYICFGNARCKYLESFSTMIVFQLQALISRSRQLLYVADYL